MTIEEAILANGSNIAALERKAQEPEIGENYFYDSKQMFQWMRYVVTTGVTVVC